MSVVISIASTYIYWNHINYSKLPKKIQNSMLGLMWPTHDWNGSIEMDLPQAEFSRRLLKVDSIICEFLHHICILLTFGLCCPVVAIAIAIYVSIQVVILLIVFGRFVQLFHDQNNSTKNMVSGAVHGSNSRLWEALELACSNIDIYIKNCMWEVVCMSSVFYALLCWDMASDRVYWKDVLWIPTTGVTIPLAMWLCYNILIRINFAVYFTNNNKCKKQTNINRAISDDVELRLSTYYNISNVSEVTHVDYDTGTANKTYSNSSSNVVISPLTRSNISI
jgi:hypothetical protein